MEEGASEPQTGRTGGASRTTAEHGEATDLALDGPGVEPIGVVPWPLLLRDRLRGRVADSDRYPWIVLATALFGLFGVGFTITILAISVTSMAEEFDSSSATLAWVVTGPMLAFAIFGPAAGKLADLYGHRRFFLGGLVGATVFAGLTALAWSPSSLIAFRVIGATLGAACGPASMAIINRLFTRETRVKAMGYWSLVMAGGPVIGAVAGGPVVEAFGWRWIFIGQVPFLLAGLLVAYAILPESPRAEKAPFDFLGSALLGGSTTLALLALNRGPIVGWTHPIVIGGFALMPLGLALFVRRQRRISHPLIPLEYLGRRNFTLPILTQMFANFAYMGGFILTPLLLQDVLDFGETRTSLVSIARPLLFAIAGPVAGAIAIRVGERNSAVFGVSCVVTSMIGLSMVAPGSTELFIMAALGLSGIGMGAVSPSMAASIANSVDERDLGIAGAAQQMMTQVAAVTGTQILQTVQAARLDADGLAGSYSIAYLVGGGVAALAIGTAFFVRSTKDEKVHEPVRVPAAAR
ncbi:MFS transporter [Actinomarinicola tropica]|uniref:MFS transporter n=1 Tax=Actinomarinicola tropica TaxID=2789776 RepID=UPI0018979DEA|nr:MFS transporter [Actinomarinicola tropica]